MARPQTLCWLLFTLALGVAVFGCRQIAPGTDSRPSLFSRKDKSEDGPPPPLPALYIPGPGPSAPEHTVTNPPSAPERPILPVSAQANVQPEILQLPMPPGANVAQNPALQQAPPLVFPQVTDSNNPLAPIRELNQKAQQKIAVMDSYMLRLRRREVVGTMNRPEEVLLLKWRKEPWSVYFKWLSAEGKGREVVYVKGRYENLLHTLTAAGDIPLLPAGKRFKISPDSVLIKSKSRYPITEAGLGGLVERFGKILEAAEKNDTREGSLKYLGQLKRPEYENMVEAVKQIVPPKSDPNLPRGGQRLWFFDPAVQLPMLIITTDETNREVEYYCHDRLMFPVHLTDDDFNPDVLWKAAGPN
jgi:Protein of unknown function (DUF1571)